MTAAPRSAPRPESPSTSWPQDVSHVPSLRIGEVRSALATEFPLLTVSKIRHYESLELICPHRTPSNQRLFSAADVERLRFVLQEQRDRFLPLSQIGELLRQLDSGESPDEVHPGRLRVIPDDDVRRPQPGTRLKVVEISDLAGVAVFTIAGRISAGVLTTDARGRLTAQAVEIVRYAAMLEDAGFDLRQVRSIKNSAHAHAAMLTAAVAPERAKGSPVAGERAITETAENSTIVSHLYRALLAENIEVNLR